MHKTKQVGGIILLLLGLGLIVLGTARYFSPELTMEARWNFWNPAVAFPLLVGLVATVYGYLLLRTYK